MLGADSVVALRSADTLQVVWASHVGARRIDRWRSSRTTEPLPTVRLLYWNDDSMPDLFLTSRYEEVIAGTLRIGTADGSKRIYEASELTCDPPELRDVDEDGKLDLIERLAGALATDECYGDPEAQRCQEHYPTEWQQVLVQRADSLVSAPNQVSRFYDSLAVEYSKAAADLRTALARGDAPSSRCNKEMADSLLVFAERARSIGR